MCHIARIDYLSDINYLQDKNSVYNVYNRSTFSVLRVSGVFFVGGKTPQKISPGFTMFPGFSARMVDSFDI